MVDGEGVPFTVVNHDGDTESSLGEGVPFSVVNHDGDTESSLGEGVPFSVVNHDGDTESSLGEGVPFSVVNHDGDTESSLGEGVPFSVVNHDGGTESSLGEGVAFSVVNHDGDTESSLGEGVPFSVVNHDGDTESSHGEGVPFSVVYHDGDTESSLGEFTVDASFNFNKFLSFLSQRIGISPHNFSVYLATVGTNRKIPFTAKVNVAAIAADSTASFFLVKRSRRPRKNKPRNKGSRNNAAKNSNKDNKSTPENVVLPRRNEAVSVLRLGDYERRLRELDMEMERFMRMAADGCASCKKCLLGADDDFHWCVYDAVVKVAFRSPAGPVARPV